MFRQCLFQSTGLAQRQPTKRAPDVWESARFSSIFLASSFSCSQTESTPAHLRVTQTVETVEKVTFQKLFLESGKETLKSIWFWCSAQHFGNILAFF